VWGALSNLCGPHFEVVAVLDWEMATVGDPLLDPGGLADETLTQSGFERLPGFESRTTRLSQAHRSCDGRSRLLPRLRRLRFTVISARGAARWISWSTPSER
jgi:aminoglycoside phosphotransferase (APT) family kinase protein